MVILIMSPLCVLVEFKWSICCLSCSFSCFSFHFAWSLPFIIILLKAYNQLYNIFFLVTFWLYIVSFCLSLSSGLIVFFFFSCLQLQDAGLFKVLLFRPCFSTRYGLTLIGVVQLEYHRSISFCVIIPSVTRNGFVMLK